jgi:release factor glutamine methyltransferase
LAAEALRLTPTEIITRRREVVPEPLAAKFWALIARRAAREPLPYLLGRVEFYGHSFLCDRRALIPRPETEILVECALEVCRELDPEDIVVDVGTGSGVIAISLALACPHLRVWGTDLSSQALQLARANVRQHRLSDRVRLAEGAGLEPLWKADLAEQVAVVVSNPPYVRTAELPGLQPEISHWEPRLALDGGPTGLAAYQAILADCARLPRLRAILLEVGYDQAEPVCALIRSALPGCSCTVRPDLSAIPRVVVGRRDLVLSSGGLPEVETPALTAGEVP